MSSTPIFIAGQTASGKSAVAIRLAERIDGEIISVDSMQVYQGLDIGTAKPSLAERSRCRHHLIDVTAVTDSFDAATFVHLAREAEKEIVDRGSHPIFCGGTGLYFKALLSGLGRVPGPDSEQRRQIESEPLEILLNELSEKDPETFQKIDRENPRRIVRAVEVIRRTGRPFSSQRAEWESSGTIPPTSNFFCLSRSIEDGNDRIHRRVDWMFKAGLLEETRCLAKQGLGENTTASQAIGYRQVLEHLRGDYGLEETIVRVKSRTRQFAKRQRTWFRNQMNTTWITIPQDESTEKTAIKIHEGLKLNLES